MYIEFSYHNPTNIYGQTPMRLSSFAFLYTASTLFDKNVVLSMILLMNFMTSFIVHKKCLIFDQTCNALFYDHIAIGTWFTYNLYLLITSNVHITNKIHASLCAILTGLASGFRKRFQFRHPIRDLIHCSTHALGILGTWFLVH